MNKEIFIKLIISISFAKESDLGWDQTIKSYYEDNERIYDFEVSGKHFKTSESNIISLIIGVGYTTKEHEFSKHSM